MTKMATLACTGNTDAIASYARRGSECAYANLKLMTRVLNSLYDDALRAVDLHAGQLALMWAIVAMEPVEFVRLGEVTLTDQTTLSRTVAKLKKARLVSVSPGRDRRVKLVALTPSGRRRFGQAMPLWEKAQQRAAALLPLAEVRALARQVRKASRQPA
jgi:DNA-binding MarR family transcriptional regulator